MYDSDGYSSSYSRQNGNNRWRKPDPNNRLRELAQFTEPTKKNFFLRYILDWLDAEGVPQKAGIKTKSGIRTYYALCKLPYQCFAIYAANKVFIVKGYERDGSLDFLKGVFYDGKTREALQDLRKGTILWEDDFVSKVRDWVGLNFPEETLKQYT